MAQYYMERKGLIKEKLHMDLYELLSYFYQTYHYFYEKNISIVQ